MFANTSAASTSTSRFVRDASGGVAVTAALASALLIGAVGCAFDFSNASRNHSRVQDVADIASLAAAQSLQTDPAALQRIAQDVFDAHFGEPLSSRGGTPGVTVTGVTRTADAVTVQARSQVPTTFAKVFGVQSVDVSVEAVSLYSVRELDMALVLDTTASMRGAKLASLQRAAGELVDAIEEVDDPGVRLSVVPFTNHVNIGTARRAAPWLDVPEDASRTSWRRVPGTSRNCGTRSGSWNDDGTERTWTGEVCDWDWDPVVTTVTWQGCVGSRDGVWDERAPHSGRDIPGVLGAQCGEEIAPLSSDMDTVRASIDGLRVQGNRTYMPAGLLWGWRALEPSAPLANTDAAGVAPTGDRVVVLMSDGNNTTSKDGAEHTGAPATSGRADAKTRRLCDAVKGDGVQVYTIAFQIDDSATRNLLRNCASSPVQAFDAANEADLRRAFKTIAGSVKDLRLAG